MVLPLIVFVVVSLLASMVALLLFDGVAWPVVIGVFSGFAAATVLNATDVLARRSRRGRRGGEGGVGGRGDERENDRVR